MQDVLTIPSVTGVDLNLRIAGPGARSYAFLIDWHIRLLAALVWLLLGSLIVFGTAGAPADADQGVARAYMFGVVVPALALYFLYHPVVELVMAGRTPGKRMAGVRIVRTDGAIPGIGSLLVRNIFRLIDCQPFAYCIGLAVTLFTQHSVRIGDIVAGTVLVYDETEDRALDRFSGAALDRINIEQAEIVRDLLSRWDSLGPGTRASLALRLLDKLGERPGDDSDVALRGALRKLVERPTDAWTKT